MLAVMTAVVRARGLEKRFGSFRALDGLDLEVEAGEVHGFLGPNGAGKSTTIRVLLGLYRSSGGEVQLFGRRPWVRPAELHRRLAYVPGDVALWPSLTGGEAIDLLIRLRGGSAVHSDRERLIEAFDFDPTARIRTLSKGNRQKVALIAAFALPVELYIFDEPTSGLDPLTARRFQAEVARVAARGSSVLLSSHILAEVEEVADRLSLIRRGRRVETGTLAELRHLTRAEYEVPAVLDQAVCERLRGVVHEFAESEGRTRFTVEAADTAAVLALLAEARITGLTVRPPSLEELFLRHYRDDGRDDGQGAA
jgi:ABC-2 type transport system ATP-binding protein